MFFVYCCYALTIAKYFIYCSIKITNYYSSWKDNFPPLNISFIDPGRDVLHSVFRRKFFYLFYSPCSSLLIGRQKPRAWSCHPSSGATLCFKFPAGSWRPGLEEKSSSPLASLSTLLFLCWYPLDHIS